MAQEMVTFADENGVKMRIPVSELSGTCVLVQDAETGERYYVDSTFLKLGPAISAPLSKELVAEVRVIAEMVKDVFPQSLQQWLDNFQKDAHPVSEINIWKSIAKAYTSVPKTLPHPARVELFRAILSFASSGNINHVINIVTPRHTTFEQIRDALSHYVSPSSSQTQG